MDVQKPAIGQQFSDQSDMIVLRGANHIIAAQAQKILNASPTERGRSK